MCVYPFMECYSNAAAAAAATVTAVVDFSLRFSLFEREKKTRRNYVQMSGNAIFSDLSVLSWCLQLFTFTH